MSRLTAPLALAGALALPGAALAQPAVFAHKAKVLASGDTIELYGLPTRNGAGEVKYFDTTVRIKLNAAGKPKRAILTAVPSPDVNATEFVAGTYGDANLTCEVIVAPFGGQQQVIMNCAENAEPRTAEVQFYSGPIADNPAKDDLIDEGFDQIPGNEQFAWGVVTASSNSDVGGCLDRARFVSARQIGNLLVLVRYSTLSLPPAPFCSLNPFKIG